MTTMHDKIPTFTHITERDVDFLLVEDFACSQAFSDWFLRTILERAGLASELKLLYTRVLHSYHRTQADSIDGEVDIAVNLRVERAGREERIDLLIENKIKADFQPEQPERYRREAERRIREGLCDECLTVLLASHKYIGGTTESKKFDTTMSYEDVIDFCVELAEAEHGEIKERYLLRKEMLLQAIYRFRRGYTGIRDATSNSFHCDYEALAEEVAPSLKYQKPKNAQNKHRTGWVRFPNALHRGDPSCLLMHKFNDKTNRPHVLLQIKKWGSHVDRLRPLMESTLHADMRFTLPAKPNRRNEPTLLIRIDVPGADPRKDFDPQREALASGLQAVVRLQEWHQDHENDFKKWARIIMSA